MVNLMFFVQAYLPQDVKKIHRFSTLHATVHQIFAGFVMDLWTADSLG